MGMKVVLERECVGIKVCFRETMTDRMCGNEGCFRETMTDRMCGNEGCLREKMCGNKGLF
jgi:hypothetical protein